MEDFAIFWLFLKEKPSDGFICKNFKRIAAKNLAKLTEIKNAKQIFKI